MSNPSLFSSLELWRGDDEAVDEGEQHRLVLVVRDAIGATEFLDDDLEKNMGRSAFWIHFLSCTKITVCITPYTRYDVCSGGMEGRRKE